VRRRSRRFERITQAYTVRAPCCAKAREAVEEVGPIGVTPEDGRPLDPAHHHVVEGVRGIERGLAGHGTEELA